MRSVLSNLLRIVERMEQDLSSLKVQILRLLEEHQTSKPQKPKAAKTQDIPSPDAMRGLWEQLQQYFKQRNREAIAEFVQHHTKDFLKNFAKVNNLPIDTKRSKKEIAEALIQLLKVGEVISSPVFTRPPKPQQPSLSANPGSAEEQGNPLPDSETPEPRD